MIAVVLVLAMAAIGLVVSVAIILACLQGLSDIARLRMELAIYETWLRERWRS
ncbi:hypothetical protein [Nocardia sp. NPDC049149]|uniref:hypothetical protein n=1 Tax=Nocardia sp. NPDC049149 TaxID=3364315 RepID=UPI00371A21C2